MQKSDQHVHKPLTTGSCFGPYFWGPLSEDPEPWSKIQNILRHPVYWYSKTNKIFKNLYYIRRPSLSHKYLVQGGSLKSLHVTWRNALLQHRAHTAAPRASLGVRFQISRLRSSNTCRASTYETFQNHWIMPAQKTSGTLGSRTPMYGDILGMLWCITSTYYRDFNIFKSKFSLDFSE